jgi:hypothetical protein
MTHQAPQPQTLFDLFWSKYPRRTAKAEARKAWAKLNPSQELVALILMALDWQREQPSWTKDDGQYIPHPATWLRGERWEDEPPAPVQQQMSKSTRAGYSVLAAQEAKAALDRRFGDAEGATRPTGQLFDADCDRDTREDRPWRLRAVR